MILVIDCDGNVHEFPGAHFHTEEMTNNLVIESDDTYAVFADGKWIAARKDRE
jgi:hypothetical protein